MSAHYTSRYDEMCDGEKNAPLSTCWIKESACMKRNRLDWEMTNPKPRFITVIHSIQIQNLEKFKEKKIRHYL